MIRNLKVLLAAVLALSAFGAVDASSASAAEFTAEGQANKETTLTIIKDGTGKTAHQVFDLRKADGTGVLSLTCNEAVGDATVVGATQVEAIFKTLVTGSNCSFAGQSVSIPNTGCDFIFTAGFPQLHIVDDGALKCEHGGQPIHFTNTNLNCKIEMGRQTVSGIKYHNLAGGTVTVEMTELAVAYNATGVGCPYGTTSNGLLTTGNMIIEGKDKTSGTKVPLKWHA